MHDVRSTPSIVVGIDGSPAASDAAVWAAGEAASKNVPLKLVYVIHAAGHPESDGAATAARSALAGARRAVEAAAPSAVLPVPLRIETEVLHGNPLATLIDLSRSAALVSVGSTGVAHTCHRAGSTAAALAGSAGCPVAVIHNTDVGQRAGLIVAEVDASPDNSAVLGWAMAEAKLRGATLRVLTPARPGGTATGSPARARLVRLIDHWAQRYPDVEVDLATVPGTDYLADYLADNVESIQLFVSGTRDRRSLGWADNTGGCSVLTVGGVGL
ncbi:MAG: universal stress protein [Mycobacterium sp.]